MSYLEDTSNYFFLSLFARATLTEEGLQSINSELEKERDWDGFLRMAQSHNMIPLLEHHVQENNIALPADQLLLLKAMMMEHKALLLARFEAIKEIDHYLRLENLYFIGLKGIILAPMLYAKNELRPMRDIDILLSKGDCIKAAEVLRKLGFAIPYAQENRWEEGLQHLPDAIKNYNGFQITVELHHDAIHRDASGNLQSDNLLSETSIVELNDLQLNTLGHIDMLNQLCRHIQGPDGERLIKLISMLDIVLYAEKFISDISWQEVKNTQPHVLNTLRCIHMVIPLSVELKLVIGDIDDNTLLEGRGVPMGSFRYALSRNDWGFRKKIASLFNPSQWWMHMYYGVLPQDSLTMVRYVIHPFTVLRIIFRRFLVTVTSFLP